MTHKTPPPVACSRLFAVVFSSIGLSFLVSEHDEKFTEVSKRIMNGGQGAVSERVLHLMPLNGLHEAEQVSDFIFHSASTHLREKSDIAHSDIPYLKNEVVSEGVIDVFRLPVLQSVLQPEQDAGELVASEANLLKPAKHGSGHSADNGTKDANPKRLPIAHISFGLSSLILAIWWWIMESRERVWRASLRRLREVYSLPISANY
jgi:hypothetical protein